MALILYRPLFWLAIILAFLLLLWLGRRRHLRWWPAFLLRFAIVVVIVTMIFSPRGEFIETQMPSRSLILLDESNSIPDKVRLENRRHALEWLSGGSNRLIVPFGVESNVISSPDDAWPQVDGRASNILSSLQVAQSLLQGNPGKITLVTDGIIEDSTKVDALIQSFVTQGNTLDVIPIHQPDPPADIDVGALWMPDYLWENMSYAANLLINMPYEAEITIQLDVDGEPVIDRTVTLPAGDQNYSFTLQAPKQKMTTLVARIIYDADPIQENNWSSATAQIFPSPQTLLITENPGSTENFSQKLVSAGINLDVISPPEFSPDMQWLSNYQVIFIHNLLADILTSEQVNALKLFISEMGRGVIFLGGQQMYTLGGYNNSLIEPMLPVELEPPRRSKRSPVTFVLVMDTSYSMLSGSSGNSPIALAREAAIRVTETLQPGDRFGILSYSGDPVWRFPLQELGSGLNLRIAIDAANRLTANGGTETFKALTNAVQVMSEQADGELMTLLLMSDGKSADGSPIDFRRLAENAAQKNITISTISLGKEADAEGMAQLANWGGGRHYIVARAEELPRIMVHETRAAKSENVQEGETSLVAHQNGHPILAGLNPADFPPLLAYNALSSKETDGANDILLSANFQDPLLSTWQYGLGRVVAWMGDVGEVWTPAWNEWPEMGVFWSQVIKYALPDPSAQPSQVKVNQTATQTEILVQLNTELGEPINLQEVELELINIEDKSLNLNLDQTAPGVYQVKLDRLEKGSYKGLVKISGNEGAIEIPFHFEVELPFEQIPSQTAYNNISNWAAWTGGKQIAWADLNVDPLSDAEEPATVRKDWWFWLLPALLIFWPIEIFIRRNFLPWR